jgi:hypothetical protein
MFEQSYINTAPAEPIHEGEFLYNYEVKSWPLSTRIYQILAASALINLLFIAILSQTPVLTAKGCDSPLVGRVCQVLDTVYVGSLLFGTEREYADVAYDPTRLQPDDEITFVDVSNMDAKLEYPGSFQDFTTGQDIPMLGQPANAMAMPYDNNYLAPGIPSSPTTTPSTPDMFNTPQVLPTPNSNPVEGELPSFDSSPSTPGPTKTRTGRSRTPNNATVAGANTNTNSNTALPQINANANTAAPQDESKADQYGVFINKRPLVDQAKETLTEIQSSNVKLDTPFKIVVEGTIGLGTDGKTIVLKNPKQIKDPNVKNDPVIEKLVTDWILRVGDSGWLGYLNQLDQNKKLKARKVSITVEQNSAEFLASIRSEQPSENEAKVAASGLGVILNAGAMTLSGDEQTFLKSATTTADGKFFVFNFKMPTADVQQIIQRKLADLNKTVTQPNSTATVGPANNTAAK